MSKTKSIIAIFVGLVALTAFASSSASAFDWKVGKVLLTGSVDLSTTASVTEPGKLTFSTETINCNATTLTGVSPQITAPASGSASSLVFNECANVGGNCKLVGSSIATTPVSVLVSEVASTVLAVFKPKTKTIFSTLEFTGEKCAFSSEVQAVTGTALVTAPTGKTEQTLQEIVAKTASGELKVGNTAAVLLGAAKLALLGGVTWSIN